MNLSHQRLHQFLLKPQVAALSLFIQGMPSNKQFFNESNNTFIADNEKISRKEKIKKTPLITFTTDCRKHKRVFRNF